MENAARIQGVDGGDPVAVSAANLLGARYCWAQTVNPNGGFGAGAMLLGIFNPVGSGKIVRVYALRYTLGYSSAGAGIQTPCEVRRFTAITGTPRNASVIPKRKTSYPDASAEVYTLVANANVTYDGRDRLLVMGDIPSNIANIAGNPNEWVAWDADDAIELQEGEGVAIRIYSTFPDTANNRYLCSAAWDELDG